MAYRSGWCNPGGAGWHDRCAGICTNGVRAATRYTLCSCACHDGNDATLANVLDAAGYWPVAHPVNASAEEVARFIDTVNAIIRAGGPGDPEPGEDASGD